jgi:hypothetical protein
MTGPSSLTGRSATSRPGEYATSARRVLEAFGVPALIEGSMYLPEVRAGITVPAPIAIGFHLVDYVAHGWDVARTLGASRPSSMKTPFSWH